MKMIYTALAVALLGGVTAAAPAQQATTPPAQQGAAQQGPMQGRGGRMMEMLLHGITLNATQQKQVDSIAAAYRAQMPAFTPGTPPSPEDRAKRRELMQKEQADIRALLTTDQQKTFDANIEEMRSRMQQRGGPPGR